jgi:hypothetical protein
MLQTNSNSPFKFDVFDSSFNAIKSYFQFRISKIRNAQVNNDFVLENVFVVDFDASYARCLECKFLKETLIFISTWKTYNLS